MYQVKRMPNAGPPASEVHRVSDTPRDRLGLLASLGYELADFELYSGWLILEESSAEKIIREFILKWFAPMLVGRLRTCAAQGAADVEPRFIDFHRLVTFVHLEPLYRDRSWVICDGDEAGQTVTRRLREKFADWPNERFLNFNEGDFERYYPAPIQRKGRAGAGDCGQ